MKALINCAKPECAWPSRFFGSINPYMLPVLGKPLIEYYLDWCSLSGIQEVLVVAEEYDEDFADFVSNGSKWGLDATVSANSGDASDEETLKRNSNFADGGVSVMSGFFFPYYDKTAHRSEVSEDPEKRIYTNAKGPRKHDYCKCKPIELESLEKYYKLCMSLLSRGTRHLTINGYGSEPGVFMGMNIVVMPEAKLEPPFVIGNNVQIEAYTRIGPCVVVGDTCIVDRCTSVENSIVLGKTYIAQDLEIRGKILFGNKVIDPVSGDELEFRDNMFSATLSQGSLARTARRAVEVPLALAIGASMLPAYAAYRIMGIPKRESMTAAGEGAAECAVFKREPGAKNSWFFKLGIDVDFSAAKSESYIAQRLGIMMWREMALGGKGRLRKMRRIRRGVRRGKIYGILAR